MGKTFKASVDWIGMVENPDQDVNPSVNGEIAQTGTEFTTLEEYLEMIDKDRFTPPPNTFSKRGQNLEAKNYLRKYIMSPKYLERLEIEFPDLTKSELKKERDSRLNNLNTVAVSMADKPIGGAGYGGILGRYTPKAKDQTAESLRLNKEAGYSPHSIYLEPNPYWTHQDNNLHEYSHALESGQVSEKTKKFVDKITNDSSDYLRTPTEFVARLQVLRYRMYQLGLYDPSTEEFTEEHLKLMKNSEIRSDSHFDDIYQILKGDKKEKDKNLIKSMNEIADISDSIPTDPNLTMVRDGGSPPKAQTGYEQMMKNVDDWYKKYVTSDKFRELLKKGNYPGAQSDYDLWRNYIMNEEQGFSQGPGEQVDVNVGYKTASLSPGHIMWDRNDRGFWDSYLDPGNASIFNSPFQLTDFEPEDRTLRYDPEWLKNHSSIWKNVDPEQVLAHEYGHMGHIHDNKGFHMPGTAGSFMSQEMYDEILRRQIATKRGKHPDHPAWELEQDEAWNKLSEEEKKLQLETHKSKEEWFKHRIEHKREHDVMPYETRADIMGLRYMLDKHGIYKVEDTRDFNMDDLNKIFEIESVDKRLLRLYDKKDIVWLMNNVAFNEEIGDDLPEGDAYAKYGTELPKAQAGFDIRQDHQIAHDLNIDVNELRGTNEDITYDDVELGASFLPIVGETIDAKNTLKSLYEGNYGDAALHAAGFMLPFVPGKALTKGWKKYFAKKKNEPVIHKGSSYIEDPNSLYRVVDVPPGTSADEIAKAAEYGTTIPNVATTGRRAGFNEVQKNTDFDVLYTTSHEPWILGRGVDDAEAMINLYGGKNPYIVKMGRGNPFIGPESLSTINNRTDILRNFGYPYTQNVGKWNPVTGQYDLPLELGSGVFTTVGKSADDLAKIPPGSIVNPNMVTRGNWSHDITTIFGPKGLQVRQPQGVLSAEEYIKRMKDNPNFKFQEGEEVMSMKEWLERGNNMRDYTGTFEQAFPNEEFYNSDYDIWNYLDALKKDKEYYESRYSSDRYKDLDFEKEMKNYKFSTRHYMRMNEDERSFYHKMKDYIRQQGRTAFLFTKDWLRSDIHEDLLSNSLRKDVKSIPGKYSTYSHPINDYTDNYTDKRMTNLRGSPKLNWRDQKRNIKLKHGDCTKDGTCFTAMTQEPAEGSFLSFNVEPGDTNVFMPWDPHKMQFEYNDPNMYDQSEQIYAHEFSHLTDTKGDLIPSSDKKLMLELVSDRKLNALGTAGTFDYKNYAYITKPTETRARLNALRFIAAREGFWDVMNELPSRDEYKKLVNYMETEYKNNLDYVSPYMQLLKYYEEDDIRKMLRKISFNYDADHNPWEVTDDFGNVSEFSRYGTELSKAEDGTETTEREKYIKFALEAEGGYDYIRAKDSAIKKLDADGKWDGKSYYKIFDEETQKYYPYYTSDEKTATIGHGHHNADVHKLYKDGIDKKKALELLNEDLDSKLRLSRIYYDRRFGKGEWDKLDENTQFMLNDYTYNVGNNFGGYKNFVGAIQSGDWETALKEYIRKDNPGGSELGRNELFLNTYLQPWVNIQKEKTTIAPELEDMPLPLNTFPTDSEGNIRPMSGKKAGTIKKETSWWRGEEGWIPDELEQYLPWFMDGAGVNNNNLPKYMDGAPHNARGSAGTRIGGTYTDGSGAENADQSRTAMPLMPNLNNDITVDDSLALSTTISDLSEETTIAKYGGQYNWALDLRSSNAKTGKEVKSEDLYSNDRYSQSASKYKRMLPKYQDVGEFTGFMPNPNVSVSSQIEKEENKEEEEKKSKKVSKNVKKEKEEKEKELQKELQLTHIPEHTISAYEEPSTWDIVSNTLANPVAAFGYSARNQDVPWGNIQSDENLFDMAIGMYNPFKAYEYGTLAVDDFKEGDYLGGSLNTLGAIAPIPFIKQASKLRHGDKFKSQINWAKWNPEIPKNKALLDEYAHIEKITKSRGTWMKNPDGTPFKGSPEQFIQMKSKNFNVAYPEGSTTVFRGQDYADDFLNTRNFGFAGDEGFNLGVKSNPKHTVKFTGDLNVASQYGNMGTNKHLYELAMKNSPKSSINLKAMGKDYGSLDMIGKPKSYFQNAVNNQQKIVDDLFNSKASQSEIEEAMQVLNRNKRALQNYDELITNPNYTKLVNDIKTGKFKRNPNNPTKDAISTDDLAQWVQANKLDNIVIDDIYDWAHGTTNMSDQVSGNYLKSLQGNRGTFDLTNPNIYKRYGGGIIKK